MPTTAAQAKRPTPWHDGPAAGVAAGVDTADPAASGGAPTVAQRLQAAGIALDRVREHLTAGRVRVDGVVVTDPDFPAPPPARIVLNTN